MKYPIHESIEDFFIDIGIVPHDLQAFQINWDCFNNKPMQVAIRLLNDPKDVVIEIVKELPE